MGSKEELPKRIAKRIPSKSQTETETEGDPSSPVRRPEQEEEERLKLLRRLQRETEEKEEFRQLKRKQKEVLATARTQQQEMLNTVFASATGPNQTGDIPTTAATVQDAQDAATMTEHYADPYSQWGHYAQSAMGYGSMDIDLSNEENREMFQLAQDAALTQYNQNNYMKQQAMMDSYRFRGTPQFLKYEDWNKIRVSREMAQLRLKLEQSNRDAAIMKMGQLEEQKRRNEWFNYHYPTNPKFI